MKIQTIVEKEVSKALLLDESLAWLEANTDKILNEVLDLIRYKQLMLDGEDGNGNVIGFYSKATEIITQGRKIEGQPYNLFDTGDFYESMFVNVLNESIEIDGNVNKMLGQDWFSFDILGLKDENINIYADLVDHNFITSHPSILKNKVNNKNFHFFFIPVDKNIERFEVYKLQPKNDLFYAMSHGVNRATLKHGTEDSRINFLDKLVKKIPNIKYDFYGFSNKQPIWGNDFNNALINSKMGLNLSRGQPTKYYSSNRIASIMGNGLLTFIDKNVGLSDFFNKKEIIFYSSINDLSDKINFYSRNDKIRSKIAKNGRNKYFKLFNESKISKYIIDISLGNKHSLF